METAADSGAKRRRRVWAAETKAEIIAEALADEVVATARRHGPRPDQVRSWIAQARAGAGNLFVPVTVAAESPAGRVSSPTSAMIRLEAAGVVARISAGTDEATLARLIRALRAA